MGRLEELDLELHIGTDATPIKNCECDEKLAADNRVRAVFDKAETAQERSCQPHLRDLNRLELFQRLDNYMPLSMQHGSHCSDCTLDMPQNVYSAIKEYSRFIRMGVELVGYIFQFSSAEKKALLSNEESAVLEKVKEKTKIMKINIEKAESLVPNDYKHVLFVPHNLNINYSAI